jgi:hypothetical protein
MLQELGYEKQPKYFGTQVTYEGSEPMSSLQSPSEEFLRWKISVRPMLQDALSMLGFVMLPVKFTVTPTFCKNKNFVQIGVHIKL